MPSYWWVNHKQTVRQEIEGGYLWSPKTEVNGAYSQFYENMRRAIPGDFVISYANGRVGFVGRVSDYAISAPKPEEFGKIGSNWATTGWLLPVDWHELSQALEPKEMLTEIALMLPSKYSPINPASGAGNQKAYLAEISEQLGELILERTGWKQVVLTHPSSTAPEFIERIEASVESSVLADSSLTDTEKEQIVKARRGQGTFRNNVLEIEGRCRVTGIDNESLLVASHIKPWRSCETAAERLDGYNGLMLTPHVDHLFDRGLISFTDDGSPILSSKLCAEDVGKLGLTDALHNASSKFHLRHLPYLRYHREQVFVG